jgi:hypothetical protein
VTEGRVFWRDDGHLTADAATAAADGELVDAEVLAHFSRCDECLRAVGVAAVQAVQAGEMLIALRRELSVRSLASSARRRRVSLVRAAALAAAMGVLAFTAGRFSVARDIPASHPASATVGASPLPSFPLSLQRGADRTPHLALGDGTARPPDAFGLRLQEPSRWSWRFADCLAGSPLR